MIGLCGAHRTGKTTLAREYAIAEGVSFVETSATETFKRLGKRPDQHYSFGDRLSIQLEILQDASDLWETEFGNHFISDRTPIDMIAYTLADVNNSTELTPDEIELAATYMDACFESSNRHFSCLILVQPGIKIVEAEGKASSNPLYIEHLNQTMMGLLMDSRNKAHGCYIPRHKLDLKERVQSVQVSYDRVIDRADQILINKSQGLCQSEVFRSDSLH